MYRISIKVYLYQSCDRCRRAAKWLRDHQITFTAIPIRETPPTREELRFMLDQEGGNLRRLFNTSGRDFRAMGLARTLEGMALDDALELLATNGNLIKRPFLITDRRGTVGFEEARWSELCL